MLFSEGRLVQDLAPLFAGKEGSGLHGLRQPHGFAGIFMGTQRFIPTASGELALLFYSIRSAHG